jgi:integrase
LRSILLRARDDWQWLDKVPRIKLFKETGQRERALSPAQAARLLQELPAHQRETVLLALATGLRQRNVLQLRWEQVDLARRHAWVGAAQSKNRKPIAVPLNETALAVLQRQVGQHAVYVFTYAGRPIRQANTKAWRKALQRAGITDFRWHDLRHTWATWQRQAGTPTHELQRLGGWKTAAMVERYAHLAPDHLATAAQRLDAQLARYVPATLHPPAPPLEITSA